VVGVAVDTRIVAAVDAQSFALARIVQALLSLIEALFRLIDPYDRGDVDRFTQEAGLAASRARREAVAVTDAYLRVVMRLMDIPVGGPVPLPGLETSPGVVPVPELPRGIPLTQQWVRPVKEYRRLRLEGLDDLAARLRALERAERIGRADIATAVRDTEAHRLVSADKVTGWRRIIHPEVSAKPPNPPGPVCGLCLVAADRVYNVGDLKPLHDLCRCTVLPVTLDGDPGLDLTGQDLRAIYDAGGGTFRDDLKRTRFWVAQHAELGPVIVNADHEFRGPAEVAKDARDLAALARAELADLERSLAAMESRAASGEDVGAPLVWQRERVAALRDLAA
jgi:hypothetical protein